SGHPQYGGGGLTVFYGTLTLTNSSVYSNVLGTGPGGGIHASYGATLTVVNSAIYDNQALGGPGGGIDVRSYARLAPLDGTNSTIAGNTAATSGGGIATTGVTPTLNYTTIAGNSALAGAQLSGTLTAGNTILAGGGSANCTSPITSLGYNLDDGNSCNLAA